MKNMPESISLANLPTKIEKLERFSKSLGGPDIWIKRDDQTGAELAGNKVRKLEFSIKEALNNNCDYLITCGGIQSNHARATAACAAKFGLGVVLVLRGDKTIKPEGNYLLDLLLGADVRFVSNRDYTQNRLEIMQQIASELEGKGHKAYIIPEGASNGIGAFGYIKAMKEIHKQEDELGFEFDCIVSATGSGGTYGGLLVGDYLLKRKHRLLGFAVGGNSDYFKGEVSKIISEAESYIEEKLEIDKNDINIIDDYVGKGYALSSPDELEFIKDFARMEGIILDPVYTGKAMYGLSKEIKKGNLKEYKKVLFIHTGGLFGLLGKSSDFFA